jgi:hypothetical protein
LIRSVRRVFCDDEPRRKATSARMNRQAAASALTIR